MTQPNILIGNPLLRAALDEYFAAEPARDAALRKIETAAEMDAWEQARQDAKAKVQEVFYQLTSTINSRAKCKLIDVYEIRCIYEGRPQGSIDRTPVEQRIGRAGWTRP